MRWTDSHISSYLSAQCCQRLVSLELNHMSVVTKSLVKELTDVGLKSIRDVQLIGTPIESDAVKLLCSECFVLFPFPV